MTKTDQTSAAWGGTMDTSNKLLTQSHIRLCHTYDGQLISHKMSFSGHFSAITSVLFPWYNENNPSNDELCWMFFNMHPFDCWGTVFSLACCAVFIECSISPSWLSLLNMLSFCTYICLHGGRTVFGFGCVCVCGRQCQHLVWSVVQKYLSNYWMNCHETWSISCSKYPFTLSEVGTFCDAGSASLVMGMSDYYWMCCQITCNLIKFDMSEQIFKKAIKNSIFVFNSNRFLSCSCTCCF